MVFIGWGTFKFSKLNSIVNLNMPVNISVENKEEEKGTKTDVTKSSKADKQTADVLEVKKEGAEEVVKSERGDEKLEVKEAEVKDGEKKDDTKKDSEEKESKKKASSITEAVKVSCVCVFVCFCVQGFLDQFLNE